MSQLFKDVKSLPAGCTLTLTDGRTRIARYWSPRPLAERPEISYDDAVRTLAELLEDSVRMRLVSDVPVGTFCSGGIDSSLVTALAAKQKGDAVNTFSIGFDEPDYDEKTWARLVGVAALAHGPPPAESREYAIQRALSQDGVAQR